MIVAERASAVWRATGPYAPLVALRYVCNSLVPLVLFGGWARRSSPVLFVVSILVLIGMWLERFNIIVPSLGRDFEPYTWGIFVPAVIDTTITIGSFGFFFLVRPFPRGDAGLLLAPVRIRHSSPRSMAPSAGPSS